ncbi:MAG: FixH family protein [Hyphomicrobium sp.]
MRTNYFFLILLLGLVCLPPTFAGSQDYEFKAVSTEIKNGKGSELSVQLIDKKTGKPVEGAVIFRTELDMSPDSMGEMKAKHQAIKSQAAATYSFKADLTMAGRWAFKLQAKVPNEKETVEGSVIFNAKD